MCCLHTLHSRREPAGAAVGVACIVGPVDLKADHQFEQSGLMCSRGLHVAICWLRSALPPHHISLKPCAGISTKSAKVKCRKRTGHLFQCCGLLCNLGLCLGHLPLELRPGCLQLLVLHLAVLNSLQWEGSGLQPRRERACKGHRLRRSLATAKYGSEQQASANPDPYRLVGGSPCCRLLKHC